MRLRPGVARVLFAVTGVITIALPGARLAVVRLLIALGCWIGFVVACTPAATRRIPADRRVTCPACGFVTARRMAECPACGARRD